MKKILVFLIMSLFLAYGCKYFKKRTATKEDTLIADTTRRESLTDTNAIVTPPAGAVSGEETLAPVNRGRYYMIVGCFTVPQNADNYVAKLKGMGYDPQILPGAGGFKMVSAKSYDNWKQIVAELDKFRSEVEPGAWVFAAK
jgi:hypothetical protein